MRTGQRWGFSTMQSTPTSHSAFRFLVLLSATLGVLTAVQTQDGPGVWNGGKAAWWDFSLLDLGLTGWGNAPQQPVAFSHALHAEAGLDCLYCHSAARLSPQAGIPPLATCIGCHRRATDQPELLKVQDYWQRQQPIPWVRVHRLPHFTRFSHKRHIRAGVECLSCHGPVDRMERVEQVSSLKMGWCVSCHEAQRADKDCLVCHY